LAGKKFSMNNLVNDDKTSPFPEKLQMEGDHFDQKKYFWKVKEV